MKPFTDEDLIAYHLHELAPRRARALERALQVDPSLAAASEEYAATLRAFKSEAPLAVPDDVLIRNWNAVRPSLAVDPARAKMRPRWHLPALVGGLAFASTVLVVATHHHDAKQIGIASAGREPGHAPPPAALPENSMTGLATPQDTFSDGVQARHPARHLLPPQATSAHTAHRRITYLSLATAPSSVLRFIPLAPTHMPALPPAPTVRVTMAPASPLLSGPGWPTKGRRARSTMHHEHLADITLAMGGTLIGTRQAGSNGTNSYSQGATHAISAVAAFHQQLRPAVGYRLTASYTRPEFQYTLRSPITTGSTIDVNGRVYELAGTYVVQGPHHGRLSTSAEAGAGVMGFLPTLPSADTGDNVRVAAVYGAAAEVGLSKHLAVHLAYRGQAFKGPDFKYTGFFGPVPTAVLLSNEPMVGITYRFPHK